MDKDLNKQLDSFLSNRVDKKQINQNTEEVCDLKTGECYTIKQKDGLVERLNKKYVIEDGRQLMMD